MATFRRFLNDADKYVQGHIYALEAQTVNNLYAEYERSYVNLQIQLESIAKRYGTGETWSASDSAFRERTDLLVSQIMAEMRALTSRSGDMTLKAAVDAYEASFYGRAWMVDTVSGGRANVPLLPAEAVRAAILAPYEGSTFVDRFRGKDDEFQRRIRQSVVQSQINGDTIYQAQKRIAQELGLDIGRRTKAAKSAHSRDFWRTSMIARTEIIRSSNQGALAVYEANKDVLRGWSWLTAKDDRVCPECGPMDGKLFAFGDNESPPPLHVNCRCSAIPSAKDVDLESRIIGERKTFMEWARDKGITQSRYGQVYDLKAQKPPKTKLKPDKPGKNIASPATATAPPARASSLPAPEPLTSAGARAMMMKTPDEYEVQSKTWATELPKAEKKSMLDYMRGDYMKIKAKLEGGNIDAQIKNILSAIEKAPPVKDITYRGEDGGNLSQAKLEEKWKRAIGTQVDKDNILSVSLNPEVAAKFRGKSGIVFQIMSNRSKYVNGLSQRSSYDNEFEAILPPGTKFKVVSAESKQIMTRNGLKNIFVVQVEDVTHGQ